jgi:hypothetical protein
MPFENVQVPTAFRHGDAGTSLEALEVAGRLPRSDFSGRIFRWGASPDTDLSVLPTDPPVEPACASTDVEMHKPRRMPATVVATLDNGPPFHLRGNMLVPLFRDTGLIEMHAA